MNGRRTAKITASAGMFLAASPLFPLLGAWLGADPPGGLLLLPAAAVVSTLLAAFLPRKLRLPALAVLMPALAASGWALLGRPGLRAAFPLLAALAMMPWLLYALSQPSGREWPAPFLGGGMAMHLAARAVTRIGGVIGLEGLLNGLFIAYFFYVILAFNRVSLETDAGNGSRPPRHVLSRNRLLVSAIGLAAVITANIAAVLRAAAAALDFIKRALAAFMAWLASLVPSGGTTDIGAGELPADVLGGPEAAGEPGAFALFLEKAVTYLAIALLAAAAAFAAFRLYRLAARALRALLRRLRLYMKHVNEAYEDKVETLLSWGDVARAARERPAFLRRRRGRTRAWRDMDSRQRVRSVFARLKAKAPAAPDARTARELLTGGALPVADGAAPRMADIYDAARYGPGDVPPGDAEYMRENAKA